MKTVLFLVAVLSAAVVGAQEIDAAALAAARAQGKAALKEFLDEQSGGLVAMPDKEPGIVFLNCSKSVPDSALAEVLFKLRREFRISCFVRKGEWKDIKSLCEYSVANEKSAKGIVAIVDDPSLPQMVSMPDSRCGIVGVTALAADKPTAEKLAERVSKMAYRTFGVTMGAAWSVQGGGLLQPVESLAALDKMRGNMSPPDCHFPIAANMKRLGVAPGGVTTYTQACLDGWAPPPKTERQKKIAEDVKSGRIKDE